MSKSAPVQEIEAPRKNGGKRLAVVETASATESATLLAMIERLVRDPSVDMARVDHAYGLLKEMQGRDARTQYLAALPRLQAALPLVERKGEGHNKKKYARFEDFISAAMPEVTGTGFSLTFRVDQTDTHIKVTAVLGHQAGHQEETSLSLPFDKTGNKNDVQALGSSISYGKRYTGMTLLGIATEDEDDDGKKAGGSETAQASTEDLAEIDRLINKTKSDIPKLCLAFDVDQTQDLNAMKAKAVIRFLKIKAGEPVT